MVTLISINFNQFLNSSKQSKLVMGYDRKLIYFIENEDFMAMYIFSNYNIS
jgi:hypothetical protein